jgi:hypothetical protein
MNSTKTAPALLAAYNGGAPTSWRDKKSARAVGGGAGIKFWRSRICRPSVSTPTGNWLSKPYRGGERMQQGQRRHGD